MSSSVVGKIFGKPKRPKVEQVEASEPVHRIEEDAGEAGQRRRRAIAARGGYASTKGAGMRSALMSALKKRLGE